jgi:hypothetical protein
MIPFSLIGFAMAESIQNKWTAGSMKYEKANRVYNAMAVTLFYALICKCFEKSYGYRIIFQFTK